MFPPSFDPGDVPPPPPALYTALVVCNNGWYVHEAPQVQEETVTLTPNTFMGTLELDCSNLSTALAILLWYGTNKEHNENKV